VECLHRYIAVHQTYNEHLLKVILRELNEADNSGAESDVDGEDQAAVFDRIVNDMTIDMDFAENYEIVHKIEIQSEHWKHQQVTLFIVITNFKSEGTWKSEAHIFVSSDRSHDTYLAQRAMAGMFPIRLITLIPLRP
jgi:hypothetical protein